MAVADVALVARARGLAGHLLTREALERLADAPDIGALGRALAGAAVEPIAEPCDVFGIERAFARTANRHLQTLARWQQRTPGVLDVFAAHQDRRSLRTLLRGSATGVSPELRLLGLLPTPSLPRVVLSELARLESPADVVRRLVVAAHPDATRLLPLVAKVQPDVFRIETALLRGFAERALRTAPRGDRVLREFVGDVIDLGNALNALLLAGESHRGTPGELFVPGGTSLGERAFVSAAESQTRQHALTALARATAGSPISSVSAAAGADVGRFDRQFLVEAIARLGRAARLEPLSSAPLLRVLLLIEAQSHDVRALAWAAMLGTPIPLRKQHLVTPA